MKTLLISAFLLFSINAMAQHALEKIWATDSILNTPESVLLDAKSDILYVSNMGDSNTENSGYISKLGRDGQILEQHWVPGLNSAKGMGLFKDRLYAAELNAVAVIDVNTGSIVERIPIEGSIMLNDITIDPKGTVYVSDTRLGKVHKIENGAPSLYMEDLKNPNGLLSVGEVLYVLANGQLLSTRDGKTSALLAQGMEASTDGIEMVRENEFIVSCWLGVIYYVKSDGTTQILLDTRDRKSNTADIGFDSVNKIVYVPTFAKNKVVAYQLK